MPKRKFEECGSDECQESGESEDNSCSSLNTDGSTDVPSKSNQGPFTKLCSRKKQKKSVSFDGVTVFYFPRKQGFTCVPSQGGSTLGMSEKHQMIEEYSLGEYTKHQRHIHHKALLDQHQQGKIILPPDKLILSKSQSSSGDSSNSSENGSEPASSDSDDDFNIDDYYFLQPVTTKQRRVLLRQSGVKKIEPVEKEECKDIRSSREVCGCNCKVFCNPETCICSQAGIKCQVDRLSFPCGCSKDGCGNVYGRIEFNPIRVRTHFIHTLMRLELEKKSEWEQKGTGRSLKHTAMAVKAANKVSSSQVVDTDNSSTGSQAGTGLVPSTALVPANSVLEGSTDCPTNMPTPAKKALLPNIDLTKFNSNERGSCRDCQSSEISDIIMRESQFSGTNQHLEACMQGTNHNFALTEEGQMGLPNVANPSESLPQVMLFSDDEEAYHAENTTTMFHFPKEESSYSESSDCSSEGSTSVEDQNACQNQYQTYAGYDVHADMSKVNPEAENPQSNRPHTKNAINTNGGSMGIPATQQNACNYDSNGSAPTQSDQKYIGLNNTSNGYKLEPISEILNPLRFPSYAGSEGSAASMSPGWSNEYCEYGKNGEQAPPRANTDKSQCTSNGIGSEFNHQDTSQANASSIITEIGSSAGKQQQHFFDGGSSGEKKRESVAVSNGGSVKNTTLYNGSTEFVSCTAFSTTDSSGVTTRTTTATPRSTRSSTAAANNKQGNKDQPKYHELKSSTQHTAEDSLASSFYTTANQVAASFDLTNQNAPSTVPSFHLSSSQSAAKPVDDIAPITSPDLFGLPPAQTAQPVATFDLPNEEHESEGYENKVDHTEPQETSPTADHNTSTQNFGEIIKESIVETVSA